MSFTVAVDSLIVSMPSKLPGVIMPIPADKTTLGPPKLRRNWDVKPGYGIAAPFCVYTGSGLATFDATFEFWDETKEALWNQFAGIFLAPPSGRPEVLSIYHPVLALPPFYINNAVVTDIEGWSMITPGRWQTRLSFLEFKKAPPFKPIKAEPGIPAVVRNPPAKPKTEQDIRMAEARARLKSAVDAGASR